MRHLNRDHASPRRHSLRHRLRRFAALTLFGGLIAFFAVLQLQLFEPHQRSTVLVVLLLVSGLSGLFALLDADDARLRSIERNVHLSNSQ